MNVLFLDDNTQRIERFLLNAPKPSETDRIICVETSEQAIAVLDNMKFDVVFLDHDLDGMHFADSDLPNTGFRVARHITGMSFANHPKFVVIHSWNHVGVAKMLLQLANFPAYVAAFDTPGFWALVNGLLKNETR